MKCQHSPPADRNLKKNINFLVNLVYDHFLPSDASYEELLVMRVSTFSKRVR